MAQKNRKKAALSQKATKALNYIKQSFRQETSLEAVADMIGMNKCSFCRLFRQATGMTFTHYVNLLRLEEAKRLLQTSDTYVFHIARSAGFRSTRHFRCLFRKQYECSPSEWRDSHPRRMEKQSKMQI